MKIGETITALSSEFARWVSRHMTRDALIDGLKTAVWVVPLTILIWVYAEQEKPSNVQGQTVQIELHSTTPDRMVSLRNSRDDMILVDLDGSKSAVERVKAKLLKGDSSVVRIDVNAVNLAEGRNSLSISPEQIEASDMFRGEGVRVAKVSPGTIEVNVDTLRTEKAEVRAPPDAPLSAPPTFTPATVMITGPAGLVGAAPVVYAIFPTTGDSAKPGTQTDVKLALDPPFDGAQLSPSTVSATFTVKEQSIEGEIRGMPIRRLYPPGMEKDVTVDADLTIDTVRIKGPKDKVERLQASNKAYAILEIQSGDIGKTSNTKELQYNLTEPDVMVLDRTRTFNYTVRRNTTP